MAVQTLLSKLYNHILEGHSDSHRSFDKKELAYSSSVSESSIKRDIHKVSYKFRCTGRIDQSLKLETLTEKILELSYFPKDNYSFQPFSSHMSILKVLLILQRRPPSEFGDMHLYKRVKYNPMEVPSGIFSESVKEETIEDTQSSESNFTQINEWDLIIKELQENSDEFVFTPSCEPIQSLWDQDQNVAHSMILDRHSSDNNFPIKQLKNLLLGIPDAQKCQYSILHDSGNKFRYIEFLVDRFIHEEGKIIQIFGQTLQNLLRYYTSFIVNLSEDISTLQLIVSARPVIGYLDSIYDICSEVQHLRGHSLVDRIYKILLATDAEDAPSLLKCMLEGTMNILLKFVSEYIYHGELIDSESEVYLIKENRIFFWNCSILNPVKEYLEKMFESVQILRHLQEEIPDYFNFKSNPKLRVKFLYKEYKEIVEYLDKIHNVPIDSYNPNDIVDNFFVPVPHIVEKLVYEPIKIQFDNVNKRISNYFIEELKVLNHLKTFKRLALLEDSYAIDEFLLRVSGCFHKESVKTVWIGSSKQQTLIVTCVKQFVKIENLELTYKAGYPLNLLMNSECINKYSNIFVHLLKLKSLNRTIHYSKIEYPKQLILIRHKMLHILSVLQTFIDSEVHIKEWNKLQKSIKEAESLDEMIRAHSRYLDSIVHSTLILTDFIERFEVSLNLLAKKAKISFLEVQFNSLQVYLYSITKKHYPELFFYLDFNLDLSKTVQSLSYSL